MTTPNRPILLFSAAHTITGFSLKMKVAMGMESAWNTAEKKVNLFSMEKLGQ